MNIDKNWYVNLNKSRLTPPSWIFSLIWPILYILLLISFILIFIDCKFKPFCIPLIYFIIQINFNLKWYNLFFKKKKIIMSYQYIKIMILYTIISYYEFYKINILSAKLLIPYLIWIFFALYLNYIIIINNR